MSAFGGKITSFTTSNNTRIAAGESTNMWHGEEQQQKQKENPVISVPFSD